MSLLGISSVEAYESALPGVSVYRGNVCALTNKPLSSSLVSANVNVIRRRIPYVYLFASGEFADCSFIDELGEGTEYANSLDRLQLRRGVHLYGLDFNAPVRTTVIAILGGDVLPFAHLLDEDEFGFLCLPRPLSLRTLDAMVAEATDNLQAIDRLLSQGGCIITVVDLFDFRVVTREPWMADEFRVTSTGLEGW